MNFQELPYVLLFLTVISLWFPRVKNVPFWYVPFSLSVLAGLITQRLSWTALPSLLALGIAVRILSDAKTGRNGKIGGACVVLLVGLGLGAHLLPGFQNLKVIDSMRISFDGIPFTLYWNFDKTAIGVFIFGWCHQRITEGAEWLRVLRLTLPRAFVIVLGLAGLSLLLGFVRIDPKLPDSTFLWAATNLLFVCMAEEVFFRGFVQYYLNQAFISYRHGKWFALLIASLLFGMAHYAGGLRYVLLATVAGLGYGWMYKFTRRLEASILTHFMLNLFHFLVLTYPALA